MENTWSFSGSPHHVQVFTRTVIDRIRQPEWATLYCTALADLYDGKYKEWADVIVQKMQSPLDIYDAAVFCDIWTALHNGQISHFDLPIGHLPYGDKETDMNNDGLPNGAYQMKWVHPTGNRDIEVAFSSQFWGQNNKDGDGHISWAGDLPFIRLVDGEETLMWKSRGEMSLEVGYCASTQLWWRLMQHRWVARWPYGHKTLYFLYVEDPNLWSANF